MNLRRRILRWMRWYRVHRRSVSCDGRIYLSLAFETRRKETCGWSLLTRFWFFPSFSLLRRFNGLSLTVPARYIPFTLKNCLGKRQCWRFPLQHESSVARNFLWVRILQCRVWRSCCEAPPARQWVTHLNKFRSLRLKTSTGSIYLSPGGRIKRNGNLNDVAW